MGRAIGAGGVVLVAMVAAGGVQAASMKCAKPTEVTAIQAAAIQQELMVAALTCNEVPNFNAFQTGYSKELRNSDATLLKMFRRLFGGSQGNAEYHAFKTRLANDSSIRSIHNNADYCKEASMVFAAALQSERPALADFVSGIQVSEQSPVDTCEIRVATGLEGTAIPTIVPKPNPLRLASATVPEAVQAPAAPAAPNAMAPQNAATPGAMPAIPAAGVLPDINSTPVDGPAAPAPSPDMAAAPPPPADAPPPTPPADTAAKDDSGWLSGIF